VRGIGVITEAATGTTEARSASGCDSDNWSSTIETPVFWTPVSIAIAILSTNGCLKDVEAISPTINPDHTLRDAANIIRQDINRNIYKLA